MRPFGKWKAKTWEFMLKVDNIIPLWIIVIHNMVSDHALNLVISIEFSNIDQRVYFVWGSRKGVEPQLKGGTNGVLARALPTQMWLIRLRIRFLDSLPTFFTLLWDFSSSQVSSLVALAHVICMIDMIYYAKLCHAMLWYTTHLILPGLKKLLKAILCHVKRIGPTMLHVFAFSNPNNEVTYWVFLKILKSCATLTFQIKVRQFYIRMKSLIT